MMYLRENKGFFCTYLFVAIVILVSTMMIGFTISESSGSLPLSPPYASATSGEHLYISGMKVRQDGTKYILDLTITHNTPTGYCWCECVQIKVDDVVSNISFVEWIHPEDIDIIPRHDLGPPNKKLYYNFTYYMTWPPEPHDYVSYDLGEISGSTLIQARVVHTGWPTWSTLEEPDWKNDRPYSFVSAWTPSTEVQDLIPAPLPLIEIGAGIGIAGLGFGVMNNYLSGRREKQMTDVTRTAAVDERFMELYNASRDVAFQETLSEVLYQYKWTDYDDFLAKYGPEINLSAWAKIQSIAQYFEGIGVLVRTDSVGLDQVYQLLSNQVIEVWEKLDDVILERRKRELNLTIYSAFESLYYAIKTYSQQGPPSKDDVRVHRFK